MRLRLNMEKVARMTPGEQAQVMALLQEYEQARLWNPLEAYWPVSCHREHPGAPPGPGVCTARCLHASFHEATQPLKAFFGGNRAGKTTTAIVDDLIQMAPRELLPAHLQRYKRWECPFYCRVMTPDMERTMKPVIHQKLREWTPKALLKGGSFDASYDKTGNSLRLECGCRFDFLSYEMAVDKFGGAALHRCHYDEEPPADIRKECLMRLIDYGGDELLSMTPLKGMTWTYRQVWRNDSPHIFKLKVAIHDNPTLDEQTKTRVLDELSSSVQERNAREFGDFFHNSGLVYPAWRSALVPTRRRGDMGDEFVVSIDPGIRYCGMTFLAFDERNASHTFAARKLEGATAPDYVAAIRKVLLEWGIAWEDVDFVIDPNAVARSAATGDNVLDELANHGLMAAKANNAVEAGVLQIRRRMRNGHCTIADDEQTEALQLELEEYVMDIDEDEDDGQFKVKKVKDHVCDAWRYGHMHRPWLPETADPDPEAGAPWWLTASPPPRPKPVEHVGVAGPMA